MTIILHSDFAATTLANNIVIADTTMNLTSATNFPTLGAGQGCYAVIRDNTNKEIVLITAFTGNTVDVMVRAQLGTSAANFLAGSRVLLTPLATDIDVRIVGPSSSTDNAVVRYDTTTGKLTQNSVVTISDTGTIAGVGSLTVGTTTIATDDKVLVNDTSASDVTKTVTTQAIADLKTTIVGITGTKAEFDTAVSDGNILYVGDITQYTDEMAQDAVGVMVDGSLTYVDGTPLLQRAALTGDVTASAGSNATTIADNAVTYAKMQDVSATDKLLGRSSALAGDVEEIACTSAGRAILDDADATAQRATLGVVIGTNVQAYDADLTTLATAFTTASASGPASLKLAEDTDNGTNTVTITSPSSIASDKTATLQDITGTIYVTGGTDVAVADGGTGVSAASITAFNNITGYTAAGATGTTSTNIVFSTSPTFVTPVLGAATATSINFGADTLSTYDEGTFTPVFLGSTTPGTPTGTFVGRYIKIGKLVHISVQCVFTSLDTMAGNLLMDALPFTMINASSGRAGITVAYRNNFTVDFHIIGYPTINTTQLNFFQADTDNDTLKITDLSATTNLYFSLTYESTT